VEKWRHYHRSISEILDQSFALLLEGASAAEAAVYAAQLLEDDPLFNAGFGSKIQSDGVARMSAGLMNGDELRFSGVVNVEGLRNPIRLAEILQMENDRTLSASGARRFARARGLPNRSPVTPHAWAEFKRKLRGKSGTIGVVALDTHGKLAAATSTGGKGFEVPGRVSDTPTVAGTYANKVAAVSATGTGEEIVEHAVAARTVCKVECGVSLKNAVSSTMRDAKSVRAQFGLIALNHDGDYQAATTTPFLIWGVRSKEKKEVCPKPLKKAWQQYGSGR
jgi:L-asparaginase